MKLTIHGYSTALFATWYFIEELGILFDAGDGVISNLLGKCGKIKHVFISHADRDHITSLLQYNQLFSTHKPTIYYPKNSGSFPALEMFSKKFDSHTTGTIWKPIDAHENIFLNEKFLVESIRNEHVSAPNEIIKSLSYKIWETKKKLKKEFLTLKSHEIKDIKLQKGESFLFVEEKTNILSYSGDTPIIDIERFHNSKILIHEATFLSKEETQLKNNKNKHSSIEEVFEMLANIKVEQLILGHFSSRYDNDTIIKSINKWIKHYNIKIPVYMIPIGETKKSILKSNPINF